MLYWASNSSNTTGSTYNVVKLHPKENAKPVFQRPHPVPYALRSAVEEELKRMENDGVLNPVEVSD